MKAFAGEAQSLSRYKFFVKIAKKEEYPMIAGIFKATVKNKIEHARILYSLLEGGKVEITAAYPAATLGGTAVNLKEAAITEHEKWADLYPEYAKTAEEEGFIHIATLFHHIMGINRIQEGIFAKLHEELSKKTLFSAKEDTTWSCRRCGHTHHGMTPPAECPLCGSPMTFFSRDCTPGHDCGCK